MKWSHNRGMKRPRSAGRIPQKKTYQDMKQDRMQRRRRRYKLCCKVVRLLLCVGWLVDVNLRL